MEEEKKVAGGFLEVYETLLAAQLRVIRRWRLGGERRGGRKRESMAKMGMALDILNRTHRPMHISEIIAAVKGSYGIELDRESLAVPWSRKYSASRE